MSTWESKACEVCKAEARLLYDAAKNHSQIECTVCGNFQISDEVIREIGQDRFGAEYRQRLSKALRFASDRGAPANLRTMPDVRHCLDDLDKDDQRTRRQNG